MPAASIGVDFVAQTAKFNADITRAASLMNTNAAKMNSSLASVKKNLAGMRAEAEGLAVGLFIREAAQFVKSNLDMAGSLGETAQQLGVTSRELQVFRAMGGQAGIAAEQMDAGLSKLTVSIGKASLGAKGQNEVFQALGISVKDAAGNVKSTGAVLGEIADKLAKVKDPAERAAIEIALFGKSGQKLDTILAGGKDSIAAYGKEAEKLGMILSDETIAKADAAADKIDELNTQLRANIANAIAQNATAILGLANALTKLTTEAVNFINNYPRLATALAGAAAGSRFGAPGAAIGAGLGFVAGDRMAAGQVDGNMDLNFRRGELEKSRSNYHRMVDGGYNSGQIRGALEEMQRQTALTRQAIAQVRMARMPAATGGAALPNYLASAGSKGGTETRTNRQILADFQAELRKRGVGVVPGAIRTAAEQNALFKKGLTPLDGYKNLSRHQNAQAIDFNRATFDENKVREAAQAAGLKGFELITESGGRKHAEWSGAGKPGDMSDFFKSQEQAQREQQQAAEEARRNQEQYQNALAGLNGDLLSAKMANVTDAATLVQMAKDQIDAEASNLKASIEADALTNPVIAAKKDILLNLVDQAAAEKKLTVSTEAALRSAEEAFRTQAAANDNAVELLQIQEQLATTQAERRAIQLRILAAERQQEEAALRLAIATSKDANERARAQGRLNALPAIYAGKETQARQATESPLERFQREGDLTAAQMSEAFESIAVQGLGSLSDGLADAIMGVRSLGDVFRQVTAQILADLLRIQIQKAIAGLVGNILGGGSSLVPGVAANFAPSASLWGSVNQTVALNPAIFAAGGFVSGPGGPTSDSIPAMLSNGEFVMRAEAVRRLGVSNLDMLNKGGHPKFAAGGFVGKMPAFTPRNDNPAAPITVHVSGAMSSREARETGDQIGRAVRRQINGPVRNR